MYRPKRAGLLACIAHAVGPKRAETLLVEWEPEAAAISLAPLARLVAAIKPEWKFAV